MTRTSRLLRIALLVCILPIASAAQEAPAKPPAHTYRLTYTVTVTDAGKRVGVQHFILTVSAPSSRGTIKMGDKIPVMTGGYTSGAQANQYQITYLDVGINIDATVIEDPSGVQIKSKVEQSSVAPAPSYLPNDPIVRQIVLENASILYPGKAVTVGSLDVPDTTRHMDIEVMMERIP